MTIKLKSYEKNPYRSTNTDPVEYVMNINVQGTREELDWFYKHLPLKEKNK